MAEQLRILIVDDEPVVRRTLELALENDKYAVTGVETAEIGLEVFEPGVWDALIVDKNLPGMNGVEFVRAIRKKDAAVAVLMVTGYASAETALETLHIGVDAYLEKPFEDIFEVVRIVDAALEKKTLREGTGAVGAINHFRAAAERMRAVSSRDGMLALDALVATADHEQATWIEAHLTSEDSVAVVRSFDAAMTRLRDGATNVIFLDADLCAHDVYEQVAELRAASPDTAYILVAMRPPLTMVTRLIELDVRAVLEKPLDPVQFEQRIGPLLDRLRRGSQARGPFTEVGS